MRWVLWTVIFVTCLAGALAGHHANYWLSEQRVFPGVQLWDLDLTGYTKQEVEKKVSQLSLADPVLESDLGNWRIAAEDIELELSGAAVAQRAVEIGRGESLWHELRTLLSTREEVYQLESAEVRWNASQLESHLEQIARQIDKQPTEQRWDPVTNQIIPGTPGRRVNKEETIANLYQQLAAGKNRASLAVETVEPPKVPEQVDANFRLSRYSTYFDQTNEQRTHNIKLVADRLHGVVIDSGGLFSFNEHIGPTTKEAGFKEAPVIIDQQFVEGLGGGICQVSSTLYNVALLTRMEIVYRQNHSLPVSYLPLGRDATVYHDLVDFIFANPYDFPIVLGTEVVENRLSIGIYGADPLAVEYSIEVGEPTQIPPEEIVQEVSHLQPGEREVTREGQPGYRVEVYRLMKSNGETHRQFISEDIYPPIDRLVSQGT